MSDVGRDVRDKGGGGTADAMGFGDALGDGPPISATVSLDPVSSAPKPDIERHRRRGATRRGWVLERRLVALLLAAVLFRGCAGFGRGIEDSANWSTEPGSRLCEIGAILDRLPSPDGAWEAVAYARSCRFGPWSGQTMTNMGVRLVSTRAPFRTETMFEMAGGTHVYDRPYLAWTAPDVVKVTVMSHPREVEAFDFEGVHMDLRVDPDDPAIVAAKRAWRLGYRPVPLGPDRAGEAH